MYQWISVEIDRKKMKTGMNKIPTLQLLRFLVSKAYELLTTIGIPDAPCSAPVPWRVAGRESCGKGSLICTVDLYGTKFGLMIKDVYGNIWN